MKPYSWLIILILSKLCSLCNFYFFIFKSKNYVFWWYTQMYANPGIFEYMVLIYVIVLQWGLLVSFLCIAPHLLLSISQPQAPEHPWPKPPAHQSPLRDLLPGLRSPWARRPNRWPEWPQQMREPPCPWRLRLLGQVIAMLPILLVFLFPFLIWLYSPDCKHYPGYKYVCMNELCIFLC